MIQNTKRKFTRFRLKSTVANHAVRSDEPTSGGHSANMSFPAESVDDPGLTIPPLPIEIWTQIIEQLPSSGASLHPILFINSAICGEAIRVLYRTIDLTGHTFSHLELRLGLFLLLDRLPERARLVESLCAPWMIRKDGEFDGDGYGRYCVALNQALRAMVNLQSLSIPQPYGGGEYPSRSAFGVGLKIPSLFEGCSFRLKKLELARVIRQDIRLLEPCGASLRELALVGYHNDGFHGSGFPNLEVLSIRMWNTPILDRLPGCELKALCWWFPRPNLAGTPYLPLRSLAIALGTTEAIQNVAYAFPSLRYLSVEFTRTDVGFQLNALLHF